VTRCPRRTKCYASSEQLQGYVLAMLRFSFRRERIRVTNSVILHSVIWLPRKQTQIQRTNHTLVDHGLNIVTRVLKSWCLLWFETYFLLTFFGHLKRPKSRFSVLKYLKNTCSLRLHFSLVSSTFWNAPALLQ
jgi:hypothetical protein